MGSRLRLVANTTDADRASHAWSAVQQAFLAVETALTRFSAGSELGRLNRSAGAARSGGSATATPVSSILRSALALAHRAGVSTGGRFDATIIHALEAAGERAGAPLPPPRPRGEHEREHWLALDRDGIRLRHPVDLGGLGKGLALRLAVRRLRALGPLDGLLIDAGGDLVVEGVPPDELRWHLGIEDPATPGLVIAGIETGPIALATSSIAVRSWEQSGRRMHHLIDPRTDRPADTHLLAVSVAHADPVWAEVWTKALFVAGVDGIADLAERERLAAWWVRDDRRVGASSSGQARERFRLRPISA
jgi:thiamine biosynthesis lipoprotein